MKKIYLALSLLAAFAVSSCSSTMGTPGMITNNPVGKKVGTAKYSVILGIFQSPMNADIGAAKAAQNGKITKIATVDYKVESNMFKTTYSTIVTGE